MRKVEFVGGFQMLTPNIISGEGDGFYISYNNNRDTDLYGSDTTALVIGQMEKFYILNGNHVASYNSIIDKGLEVCMKYFRDNIQLKNRYSDNP